VSTLVIGVGSPFGDDRIGWEVAAALEQVLHSGPASRVGVRTCILDRPGAALLDALRGVRHAVIIDAAHGTDSAPGTLQWLEQHAIGTMPSASSHGFGLAEALALGRALGALPPRVDVLAVSGGRFEGETLSEAVMRAVPAAVRAIEARLLDAVGDEPRGD
jgi:hydrogenase maturation protease